MEIREVHDELIEPVRKFLASREGFRGNWDGLFNYSWKMAGYPYGYAILDQDKVAAFVGTIFSERISDGERSVVCNLTTWYVEDAYRHQRLGLLVLKPILARENLFITSLTPGEATRRILEQLGFQLLEGEQIVVPILPEMTSFLRKRRTGVSISFDKAQIREHLNPPERRILEDHSNLACRQFLINEESTGRHCYGVATTTPLGRFQFLNAQWLNLCYLSDPPLFARNFRFIARDLWLEGRFVLLRYDARLLPSRVSRMESRKPKTRQFKSARSSSPTLDNLYSELVTFNKY